MKTLVIAVVLGALGYYLFFYENTPTNTSLDIRDTNKSENQKLRDEYSVEEKTYEGALTETYKKIKGSIDSAKESVSIIEKKSREASEI